MFSFILKGATFVLARDNGEVMLYVYSVKENTRTKLTQDQFNSLITIHEMITNGFKIMQSMHEAELAVQQQSTHHILYDQLPCETSLDINVAGPLLNGTVPSLDNGHKMPPLSPCFGLT